jgi:hypothetical protein
MSFPLYWQCEKCGWTTPRHPDTKPEDMPPCHQHLREPKIIGHDSLRNMSPIYQYECLGKMIAKSLDDKAPIAQSSDHDNS